MPDFVHLHVHTHYSTLDGACRVDDLIKKAERCGMPAVAMTDHGNLFGAVGFYRKLRSANLKPIIGYEAYVARGSRLERSGSESPNHLTLLVENERGYRNLIRLASSAYLDGHYFKPRIDKELLAAHAEGLIGLSGCLTGEASRALIRGDRDAARGALTGYREMFGRGRFFLEMQENGLEEQDVANRGLVELARELDLPLVATNDVHYIDQADAGAHDVLLCIGTGKHRSDTDRLRFASDAYYFRTPEEMATLFAEVPESLRSTVRIAEMCDLKMKFGEYHYPRFELPGGESPESHLRRLVEKGAAEGYGEVKGAVRERMERELDLICRMGFAGYMLVVADIVRFAREHGIPVGPGRGSAVGSLVCYALGITKLDPLRYDLIFERFVNEGRREMPDIDLDFCQSRRDEVLRHVAEKYGKDRVAQIITFGTMAARASIRDVGRVLDVPLPVVDSVAKLVPYGPGVTLDGALTRVPELRRLIEENETLGEVVRIATRLEGLVRQPGTHAAGVVVADRPLIEYCPLYRPPGTDDVITQYEMNSVTAIGLLKIDLLGLQTLTILDHAVGLVRERRNVPLELDDLPLDDEATYGLFAEARTKGIFQFESSGMRDLARRARPERLEDLIALNALFRPGPLESGQTERFVKRKAGLEDAEPPHKALEDILRDTLGVVVYQEQVMRIAQVMAGFDLAEADSLRYAMGKKKAGMMTVFRKKFVNGAVERGIGAGLATEIYDHMERFAGYAFNKSHAAAYAYLAYQAAFLKANYPTEFMSALLTLEAGSTDKVAEYAAEARRMGIEILPPDANESGAAFTITGPKAIRFGMAAVKGVGEKAVEAIVDARESGGQFGSLVDFCERVDLRLVNKSVIEALVKAGAYDSLLVARARLFEGIGRAMDIGARAQADRAVGQESLFGETALVASSPDEGLPDVPEWAANRRLQYEKGVLGLYVSGHPLAGCEKWLDRLSSASAAELAETPGETPVLLGGIIASVQIRRARRTGNRWARVVLEDLTGSVEARIFSRVLEALADPAPGESATSLANAHREGPAPRRDVLKPDRIVFVKGRVDRTGGAPVVLVDEVVPLAEAPSKFVSRVVVELVEKDVGDRDSRIEGLRTVLAANPGGAELRFRVVRPGKPSVLIRAADSLRVGASERLESEIEAVLGPERITFVPVKPTVERREGRPRRERRPVPR